MVNPKAQKSKKRTEEIMNERKSVNSLKLVNETQQAPISTPTPEKKPYVPEVFKDVKTGELSGITTPTGKTLLGLDPEEVREKSSDYLRATQIPTGTISAGEAAAKRQVEMEGELAAQRIGKYEELPAQEAPIDYGQAITAGVTNAIPSAVAGAAALGGAALLGTGGTLTLPAAVAGGIGGAVTGIFSGIKSNIKSQQAGNISAAKKVLTDGKTNLRQLVILASKDPANADEYVTAFNNQLALIQKAHTTLKLETQGNLNKFMDDGTEDLAEFDIFYSPGGLEEIYRTKMAVAVSSGMTEFTAQDLEAYIP